MEALAIFKTEHAARYLTQLCRHFAHKVDVSYDGDHGECRFICGTAILDAKDGELRIRVQSHDDAQLRETQTVVERHLVQFAFREAFQSLRWQQRDDASAQL
ncbi:DUF2218 domain-containing protein [Agrobacterium tumefaciens]|nr:DUF2218 domain-containing protein [Agrobacterium tumefaciens]